MTRRKLVASVAIGLLVLSTSCVGPGDAEGGFKVVEAVGDVRARPEGASWRALDAGEAVASGTVVRIDGDGGIELARGAASTIEVRPFRGQGEFRIGNEGQIEIRGGDALVVTDPVAPLQVESSGVAARMSDRGVFRFDRRLSLRVSVYDGEAAAIASVEGTLAVPPLQQAIVGGGTLPRASEPLAYAADDPWDQRLLGDVLQLDRELEVAARGFRAEFGERLASADALAPIGRDRRRSVAFVAPHLAGTDSADVLIGTVLALQLDAIRRGRAARIFPRLLALVQQGATWSLLARQHGVVEQLGKEVVRAIGLLAGVVEPGKRPAPTPAPAPTLRPRRAPREPTSVGSPREPRPTQTASPRRTRSPKPTPKPTRTRSPSPSPSPSPSCDPVDDLLDRC